MSPHVDEPGGSRHRAAAAGVQSDVPTGAGTHRRPGPSSVDAGDAGAGASADADTADDAVENENEDGTDHGTGDGTVDAGEDALAVALRERDEYLDMLRRVQADFENYKKRMLRQQTDQLERASENLVARLLPALDAFGLARAHLHHEDAASPEVKALLQASGLVDDMLAKEGLERIDDAGAPFDPTVHDAVEHAPAVEAGGSGDDDAAPAGALGLVVADVLRPGYRWKGRVIRPAMVRVRG